MASQGRGVETQCQRPDGYGVLDAWAWGDDGGQFSSPGFQGGSARIVDRGAIVLQVGPGEWHMAAETSVSLSCADWPGGE